MEDGKWYLESSRVNKKNSMDEIVEWAIQSIQCPSGLKLTPFYRD